MTTAIVCGDADGNAGLITTRESLERHPELMELGEVQLYCVRAGSFEECLEEHFRIEGRQ